MSMTSLCPRCSSPVPDDAAAVPCPRCRREGTAATATHLPAPRWSDDGRPTGGTAVDLAGFVTSARELGLVEAEFLDRIAGGASGDATRLARALVQSGLLTAYQAGALLQGKARGLLIGEYLVLDKLGAGGMGVVFKARHRPSSRTVALKLLPPSFGRDRDAVRRFRREFEVAGRLRHPNVVAAIEAGEDRGVHFLAMEYLEGYDLERLVDRGGPMSIPMALHCAIRIARGLEAAHALGIVHRDIKPGNVMIDPNGAVRVLDLGLARVIEATSDFGRTSAGSVTRTGACMGTVDFLAPEQADDAKRADHRADIYSLGCTLYFLLTGRTPFEGETVLKRLMAHQERPAPSLRAARPEVSEALDAIYQRMMAKRPADRPPSVSEVAIALEACRSSPREADGVDLWTFARTVMKRAVPRDRRGPDTSVFARDDGRAGLEFDPDLRLEDLVLDYRDEVHPEPLPEDRLPPRPPRPLPPRRRRRPAPGARAGLALLALVVLGLATARYVLRSRARDRAGLDASVAAVAATLAQADPPAPKKAAAPAPPPPAPPSHGRLLFSEDFSDPSTGWPAEDVEAAAKPAAHHWGYADGSYRLDANAIGSFSWPRAPYLHDFYCEVRGRVYGDQPSSRGSLLMEVITEDDYRGFQVRLTTEGEAFLEPSFRTANRQPDGPRVGPIRHPSIRSGGREAFNVIGLRVVARRVEVFVNGARVIGPVVLDWDDPGRILLGVAAEVPNVRAEYDRFELRADSIRGDSPGMTPVDASGRKLNLDFETGTLRDWKAEGDAFTRQPVEGDVVRARRDDMVSEHQGRFWVCSYEHGGDALQGTLTSSPFRVTQPFASFLVAGGKQEETCVELVRKDTGRVIARFRGRRHEELIPVSVDLGRHVGQEIFIRLVDRHSDSLDWAHINFDDFRLHPAPPGWSAGR